MSETRPRSTSILRHWYWMWLVSAGFVGVMIYYFFGDYPPWLHYSYRGVSLVHEMSYAVWWSGISLFLAGIVFAAVGHLAWRQGEPVWPWLILAVAMTALCYDEIGSLHESVSRVAGWLGLLPFALVFAVGFGFALLHLVRRGGTFWVAFLIVLGVGMFASVAALEALEHDLTFQHIFWRRARLIGEEAIELIAMGILITAGLIAFKKLGDADRSFLHVTGVVVILLDWPFAMFGLLLLQILATATFVIPNYTVFPEGNPSALFSILLFFCLAIICWKFRFTMAGGRFWWWAGWLFVLTSLLQVYNLNHMINLATGKPINLLTGPPLSWMITMSGLMLLLLYAWRNGMVSIAESCRLLLPLLLIALIAFPDLDLRFRDEFLYFIFSSATAYTV